MLSRFPVARPHPGHLAALDADFIRCNKWRNSARLCIVRMCAALLVRDADEQHTITTSEDILDLWRRTNDWLLETMPSNLAGR
jgi:hypothetical protein